MSAFGLAIFLEGLPYFVSPQAVRRYVEQLTKMGDGAMRAVGVTMMAIGLVVAYMSLH